MINLKKIDYLREYISDLTQEVKLIEARRVQLSSNGYYDLILQKKSLCNLIALAKNELNIQLNQYNFVVSGKVSTKKGEIRDKILKGKVFSEFNFLIKHTRGIDFLDEALRPLIELVRKECANKFIDSQFEIRSLRKIKKQETTIVAA